MKKVRKCQWERVVPSEQCSRARSKGIDFCDYHVEELERRAAKALKVNALGGTYLSKFITALLGAAGSAAGKVLIENWDTIWSQVNSVFMHPPALVGPRPAAPGERFLVRLTDDGRFVNAFLEPIEADQVVRWFEDLVAG